MHGKTSNEYVAQIKIEQHEENKSASLFQPYARVFFFSIFDAPIFTLRFKLGVHKSMGSISMMTK